MKNILQEKDVAALRRIDNTSIDACLKFIEKIVTKPEPFTLLDIGAGRGRHYKLFKKCGIDVKTTDLSPVDTPDFIGDFLSIDFPYEFDAVWCNHVLEHQINVNLFLRKVLKITKEGGIICISVPKAYYRENPHKIVSGHVTMWNAGLLLYNMILAGFDCSTAHVLTKNYNVSVLTTKKTITDMPKLTMNRGDIERLQKYFPFKAEQGFNGDIGEINWT